MYVDQMKELMQLLIKKLHTLKKKELHTSIQCYMQNKYCEISKMF